MDWEISSLERAILVEALRRRPGSLSLGEACTACCGIPPCVVAVDPGGPLPPSWADDSAVMQSSVAPASTNSAPFAPANPAALKAGDPSPPVDAWAGHSLAPNIYYRDMAAVTQAFSKLVRLRLCSWRRAWIRGSSVGLAADFGHGEAAPRQRPHPSGIVLTVRGLRLAQAFGAEISAPAAKHGARATA